jgi:WD40 repeat protein
VIVDGRQLLASASDDATVRIWDPATGAQRAVLEGHHGIVRGVCAVTVADRNLLASVGADRTVRIWDPATRRALAVIRVERSLFACAPIGCHELAAGGEGGVYGFDILLGAGAGE